MDDKIIDIMDDWMDWKNQRTDQESVKQIYDFTGAYLSKCDIVHILNFIENWCDENG